MDRSMVVFDKKIVYVFMLIIQLLLIFPEGLTEFSQYRYIRLTQTSLFLIALLVFFLKYLNDSYLWINLLFFICFFLSTYLNHGSYQSVLLNASRSFGIITFSCAVYDSNPKLFWKSVSDYFTIMAVLNTFITLLYPEGLYDKVTVNGARSHMYLLGVGNQVMPFYIIAIVVALICKQKFHQSAIKSIFLVICYIITVIPYDSSTSLVMMAMFCGIMLLPENMLGKIFENKTFFIQTFVIGIGLWYWGIVIFRIQEYFQFIIVNILHKDVTLSTRTGIWDTAIEMIKQSPIYGYGGVENRYVAYNGRRFSAHNLMLQILLMGGVILLIVFVVILIKSLSNWDKANNSIKRILLAGLLAYFLGSTSEVYMLTYLLFFLFLCRIACNNDITEQNDNSGLIYRWG